MKQNDNMMGFKISATPARKHLRGVDNITIHEQEIIDMKASLIKLRDSISEETNIQDQEKSIASAELSLAEQLDIEVRTLRKFINSNSREFHQKTFIKFRDGLKGITLEKINKGGKLANYILDPNIDALIIRYAHSKDESLSDHIDGIKKGIEFITENYSVDDTNYSDILTELDEKNRLEKAANILIEDLKKEQTYFFANKVPSFNRPKKELFARANYILVFSTNADDSEVPSTITSDVPWEKAIYKTEFELKNSDKLKS